MWAGGAEGRAVRGHSAGTPRPCHLGMESHIPSAPGVLAALRLHKMVLFGFRQLSFPLRHRHGSGCFLPEKWEMHYVYGDTLEPLASLVPAYANIPCWWASVGMGQDVVSFVSITLGRATDLFLCPVQHCPLLCVP